MEINRCTCDMFVREIGKWLVSNDAVHKVYIGSGDAAVRGMSTSPFFYLVFTIVFGIVFEMSLAHLCNILLIGTLTLLYFSG